jgi:hypothetical protein
MGTKDIAWLRASSVVVPIAAAIPWMPSTDISVSTQPGQIALTCTLSAATSSASARTIPRSPALDAQ